MFRNIIRETPMTTPGANEYFSDRIDGQSFDGDTSFLGTLRALMDSRIPDGETLRLYIQSGNTLKSTIESRSYDYVFRRVMPYFPSESEGILYVHSFNICDSDCSTAFMNMLRVNFRDMYGNDWHVLEDVTTLYRKTFECVCFVNPTLKSTAVFVSDMNMRKYHYLQCSILGMLPWYFDREKGITAEETELIYSLREKSSDKYNEAIAKFALKYDFETSRLKKLLQGFESRYERKQMEDVGREIESIRQQINEMNDAICRYIRTLNEKNVTLLGLKAVIDSKHEDSELMHYFQHNKSLYLEDVSGSKMSFCVKGILSYFDPEAAKHMIDTPSSFVYEYCARNGIGKKDIRDLMIKVFVDQEVQIKFCSAYRIDLNGNVKGLDHHDFPASFYDYMPNPHIQKYSCLGNYSQTMNILVQEGKYIEAIEQCIASSRSLNWSDFYVMSAFFEEILSSSCKCFILPDGTEVCVTDALEWVVRNREESESAEARTENNTETEET